MKMKKTKTVSSKNLLPVNRREIFGKKLNQLRQRDQIPGNVFGPDFKSQSISLAYRDFVKMYRIVKETGIVYLQLGTEEIPVLIKNIQKHPVSDKILHVDLRKIDLKQKITTAVPVKVIGESTAVTQLGGVLLTQSDRLMVEAFPQDIPQAIEVDITLIKEIGKEITVADLTKSTKYVLKEDLKKVIVSVIAHKEESTVAETTTVAPEVITAKPDEEGVAPITSAPTEEKKASAPDVKKIPTADGKKAELNK